MIARAHLTRVGHGQAIGAFGIQSLIDRLRRKIITQRIRLRNVVEVVEVTGEIFLRRIERVMGRKYVQGKQPG